MRSVCKEFRPAFALCSVLAGTLLLPSASALAAEPTPVAPTIESESVTGVSEHGATLEGQINPNGGGKVTYVFEYGASTAYGATAPTPAGVINLGGEGGITCGLPCEGGTRTPQPVSESLTTLEPGATYHYRLVATNTMTNPWTDQPEQSAMSYGEDATFTTAPASSKTETSSGAGQPTGSPMVADLSPVAISTTPVARTTNSKATGNAGKLEEALKVCVRKPKRQRAKCERQARGKYARTAKDTGKQH
jgi:hypothetical protein